MCDQVYLTIRSDNLLIFFLSIKKKKTGKLKRESQTLGPMAVAAGVG
jgi:hypothetical protein